MIGAIFAWMSSDNRHDSWYTTPALFAVYLASTNLIYVTFKLRESLPIKNRNKKFITGISQAFMYINPIDLFQFKGVSGLNTRGRAIEGLKFYLKIHRRNVVLDKQNLKALGRVYFVYLFIYSGLEFTLSFLTHYKFNFTSMHQGWMFLCIGLIMAILQGSWIRRVPPHKTKKVAEMVNIICF